MPNPENWNETNAKKYGKGIILSGIWPLTSGRPIGSPSDSYLYGLLITFDMEIYNPTFTSMQMYIADHPQTNGIYVRNISASGSASKKWCKISGVSIDSVTAS